jgi:stage V sporulation protein R
MSDKLLYKSEEWNEEDLKRIWAKLEELAEGYGITYYAPRFQLVTCRQMLEIAAFGARPTCYNHWSFGKQLESIRKEWESGKSNAAYEMIFHADPAPCYCMEDNNTTMQTLVLAHAAVGHSSFFKNNYLMKESVNSKAVLPRLTHAKEYIEECEKKYGEEAVEAIIDHCHALQWNGVDKYKRQRIQSGDKIQAKIKERMDFMDKHSTTSLSVDEEKIGSWQYPEENILYFLEKNGPYLKQWEREIIRIVRTQAQYFYPNILTKVMNEGWACFWHYTLLEDLYKEGYISEGNWLEVLHNHTNVCNEHQSYSQHNPYAIGFEMWMDIKRACENPTEEDYEFLPLVAGTDWAKTFNFIMENFKDETFVQEFLGPNVIRKFKLFAWVDDAHERHYDIKGVQDKEDLYTIRKVLSKYYTWEHYFPSINIVEFDTNKDRTLVVEYMEHNGKKLKEKCKLPMIKHLQKLWRLPVEFRVRDKHGDIIDGECIKRRYV